MDIIRNVWRFKVGFYIAKYLAITHRYHPAIALFQECLQLPGEYFPTTPALVKIGLYINLWEAHYQIREFEKALLYCQSWRQAAKDLGGILETMVFYYLAWTYISLRRYKDAVECFERFPTEGSGDIGHINFHKYSGLGIAHYLLGHLNKAVDSYETCLEIAKKANNKFWEVESYSGLGQALNDLGKLQKAKEYLDRQLVLAKELGDKAQESEAYNHLGNYYHGVGDYKVAIEYHTKQLAIAKEIESRDLQQRAFGGLGRTYSYLGNSHEAMENLERSLRIAKEERNKEAEGIAYNSIGNEYKSRAEYGKAIEYFTKSLEISESLCKRGSEAIVHGNLGITCRQIGDYEKAIFHLKKDLEIKEEMGNRAGVAIVFQNLGNVYLDSKNSREAIKHFEKAHEIFKETDYRPGLADVCGCLGNVYLSDGDLEKARKSYIEGLHFYENSGYRFGEGVALISIGNLFLKRGDYSKAIEYHEKGLYIFKEAGRKGEEADTYMMLGQDHEDLRDYEEAKKNYLSAIKHCEEIQEDLENKDDCKVSISDLHDKAYRGLSRVLLLNKETEEALVAVERGHSRALADLMRSSYLIQTSRDMERKPLDASDIKRCAKKVDASTIVISAHFDTILFLWVIKPAGGIFLRDASVQSHSDVGLGFESIIRSLYVEIGVTQEEFQCEDRSLAILYERQQQTTKIKTRPKSREAFEYDVLQTMRKINLAEDVNRQPAQQVNHDFLSPLRRTYNILIGPVADLLQDLEILVVPEGPFYLVPMAALKDENGRFLSETFRIRVVPSLTTMNLIQESPADYHSESGALIVGDPNVGEVEFNGEIVTVPGLEFARAEAEMIGNLLSATPLLGDKATKEEVLKQMTTVGLIHIATHGDSATGEIALAPNPTRSTQIPKKEDFLLSMADVHKVRLRARLVVLSCCHSGRGKIKAEGVVGIARAFLGAGARSVLVSLWAIDDAATMEFMRSFYEHLHGGESASEALHQAMKCLRESQQFKDVKYWAPFVLMGDDVKLKFH